MTMRLSGWMRDKRNLIIGTALGLLIVVTGNPAIAAETSEASPKGTGLKVVSWLVTIPYGAVKVAYAVGGGIVGGFAWVFTGGSTETAKAVWIPSMTGDYIVHPEHLTGEKSLHFVGETSDNSKP